MTLAAYNGHEPLTFSDYLDLDTGKTLHAEPGRTYDVAPTGGRVVPEFPEPWFARVEATAAGDVAADYEDGGEPAHDEEPETGASQQF